MTAFNVVRFRIKSGRDEEFISAHKVADPGFSGLRRFSMVHTGPGTYCIIGEWDSFDDIVGARPGMIGMLDTFRHLLEDQGPGIGITDPMSGSTVLEMAARPKKKAKRKSAPRAKPAKKKAAKKASKKAGKRKNKR